MNPNTLKMTKIVACDNLFSSHYQWLMSANLHFLTGMARSRLDSLCWSLKEEKIEQFGCSIVWCRILARCIGWSTTSTVNCEWKIWNWHIIVAPPKRYKFYLRLEITNTHGAKNSKRICIERKCNSLSKNTDMILFGPKWHIRLRSEISIAPYTWLSCQVLSMRSLLFSFLPRSSSSKFLIKDLAFLPNTVSTLMQFVLPIGLSW